MIVKPTPAGLVGYITPADFERVEQYARRAAELEALAADAIRRAGEYLGEREQGGRPRFKVLLNPDAGKNSKTAETSADFPARALRVYACNNRPRSISENITLQK